MADNTKIEWTDATWNPVTGCSIKSPGCINCYAQTLAGTRLKHHPSRKGLTEPSKNGPVFNGRVRFNEGWLTQPLSWRRPRRIFVCAHGDLFHENVPDAWIDKVFAVMALSPQHQFQVLTKRAERMREYVGRARRAQDVFDEADSIACRENLSEYHPSAVFLDPGKANAKWPLPNVWLGVSAERQEEAAERIPDLLQTPAAVRFISAEPLLGPIDLSQQQPGFADNVWLTWLDGLDWVIAGGESGRNARPMHPAWARSLRDQCNAAGVPFFFKQWGEWGPDTGPLTNGDPIFEGKGPCARLTDNGWGFSENGFTMPLGGNQEWLYRLGKKITGRLLDGVEHSEFPA